MDENKLNFYRKIVHEQQAEIDSLRKRNESLVKWKGAIDGHRILRGLPFPADYDNSPKYAVASLIEAIERSERT